MLPLAKPRRGRAVNSQFELTVVVELNDVASGKPVPVTPELADMPQPLKSVSKPSTKWPTCQLYPTSAPPMTPLGAAELVPTAARFGATAAKPPGLSLYFELPNAPPIVPPT